MNIEFLKSKDTTSNKTNHKIEEDLMPPDFNRKYSKLNLQKTIPVERKQICLFKGPKRYIQNMNIDNYNNNWEMLVSIFGNNISLIIWRNKNGK